MVRSMTGYGRADSQDGTQHLAIEIRSVNHRYREISIRLPRALLALERRIQEQVRQRALRGKINVVVALNGDADSVVSLSIDESVAERYLQLAKELKTRYSLQGNLNVESVMTLPHVLSREESDLSEEAGWAMIEPHLAKALDAFDSMRTQEGAALARDLQGRVQAILAAIERVEQCVPDMLDHTRTRLYDRLEAISKDAEYNKYRLEAELLLFADRADITEECVRLRSHCDQFLGFIEATEPAGRRFKFLLEEMHREVNTIGSKAQDTGISRDIIYLKEEIEKIREQVMNIE